MKTIQKHIFYVDDLKLYVKSDGNLVGLLSIMKKFSGDIEMQFGLN